MRINKSSTLSTLSLFRFVIVYCAQGIKEGVSKAISEYKRREIEDSDVPGVVLPQDPITPEAAEMVAGKTPHTAAPQNNAERRFVWTGDE